MLKRRQQQRPKPVGDMNEVKIVMNAFKRRDWSVTMVGYPPNHTIIAKKPGRTVRCFYESRNSEWIFVEGTKVTRKFKKFLSKEDKHDKNR